MDRQGGSATRSDWAWTGTGPDTDEVDIGSGTGTHARPVAAGRSHGPSRVRFSWESSSLLWQLVLRFAVKISHGQAGWR